MTDTAEFNFYGAHQIDFSTIKNVTARHKKYTLSLPKFIDDLKQGNIHELRQARTKIPEIFQSYRFIDYLLLKVDNTDSRYYLDDLRKQCITPSWVQHTPLSVPEKFELSWEISSEPDNTHEEKPLTDPSKNEKNTATPPSDSTQPTPEEVHKNSFDKKFQTHQEEFATLINKLEEFSCYCNSSHDSTVLLYQPIVQELKKEFVEIGRDFFTDVHNKDKETLTKTFEIFKSSCARLCQKAEKSFKHNTDHWSYLKPILRGFLGVIIAIASTILTLGILTYHVANDEHLHTKYIDTFFKPNSCSIQDLKNKWNQYAIKQKLFGDEPRKKHGLINEIEGTISAKLRQ